MATRMQQRRGTAQLWSEVNPVLSAGEIGYETDTGKFKIGDDVNVWNDLPYFLNVEELNNGGALDQYLLSEELGVSIAQLVNGKVPASQLNLTEYAKTSEVTTAVNNAVSGLVDGAPELLNTLSELAEAVNNDEGFATAIFGQLGTKLDDSQLGVDVASLDVDGRVPQTQLFYAIDHTNSQIETLLEDTITPLDSRVATVEQLKQDKVTGVSDAEIGTLSDIRIDTTIQAQLDEKLESIVEGAGISFDPQTKTVDVKTGYGLEVDSQGQIAVNVGQGISSFNQNQEVSVDMSYVAQNIFTTGNPGGLEFEAGEQKIKVMPGNGIVVNSQGVGVRTGYGLEIDGQSRVGVKTGYGISTMNQDISVDRMAIASDLTGSGLQTQMNKIGVKAGNGINVSNAEGSSVEVSLATDSGLEFTEGDLKVDPGTYINVDSNGVSVNASSLVNGIVGNGLAVGSGNFGHAVLTVDTDVVAAKQHDHTVSEITDITVDAAAINSLNGVQGNVQDQLDDKSDVGHTHTLSEVVDVTASFAEVNRLVGVTSNVQDQIDSKQDEITGAASTVVSTDLSASRAVVSNASGKLAASSVTTTELGHLSGVTSGIQSQLDGKSANGHTHDIEDISGLIDVTATQINFLGGAFPVTSSIQSQLNGKASTSHVHDISDVTGLQDELDAKLSLSGGTMTGKITLDGDPTQANHAANKAYVDSLSEGLHVHASVIAATTTNINLSTDLENGDVLDGVTLATGNRVLVKNQTNAAQNGIYVVQSSGAAVRATDFDSPAEVDGGDFVFVNSGTINGDTGWVQVTDAITTIGTDPINFTQFSGAGTVKAGTNIVVNGYEVSTVTSPTFSNVTVNTNLTLGASGTLTGINLDKLSDVNVSSAGMGDTLVHNGTEFVNIHVDNVPARIKQASITSNAYTLSATADVGRVVEVFNANPTTILIPENDTFHVGTMIVIMQTGSGQVTVATAGAGTTLNSTPGSKLRAQWSVGTLLKRSEGVWLLYGDLVA